MRAWSIIVVAGMALVIVGLAIRFAPWLVSWFGRLPGDIRAERATTRIYIPITSMIVVSVVISAALMVFSRLRN